MLDKKKRSAGDQPEQSESKQKTTDIIADETTKNKGETTKKDLKSRLWWCVVYPPLCMTAATDLQETALTMGLGEEDISLMTEENTGYVLKFRSVELWENLRQWLQKI